jgi:PPP family 3-phenylpropionic acid transporter
MLLLAAGLTGYGALAAGQGVWTWAPALFLASTALGAVVPLTDVIVLRQARRRGFDFGQARGVGSAAFIVANLAMGVMLAQAPPWIVLAWVGATVAAALVLLHRLLPFEPVSEGGERTPGLERLRGVGRLLRDPVFVLALVSIGLVQASHGFYYGFSALLWRDQGVSEAVIGALWGVGVAAEVVFLALMAPLQRRLGPARLFILGAGAAMIRWTLYALEPGVGWLFVLQTLHALSFAATFMGALQTIERLSPPETSSAAQTLNSALSGGLLIGLATLASGPLYDRFGSGGYLAMAAVAAVGLLGALRVAPALSPTVRGLAAPGPSR